MSPAGANPPHWPCHAVLIGRPGAVVLPTAILERETMATAEATEHSAEIIDLFKRYVVPNYRATRSCWRAARVRMCGTTTGTRYLDFFPGWGCNLLGHCPEPVVKAVQEQVATLIHVPNTWYTEAQGRWAKLLSERSFGGQAFFCNSGTEANEAAIKLARLHAPKPRYKIITFEGGFHGRTLGATAATAQPKYHEGLGPLMAGFVYVPFGDLEAVERLVDDETAAIMVEPVQGEGGINFRPTAFLRLAKARRRAWLAAGVRRSADRLRPHRQLVRLSTFRRHARHHDAGQGRVRRHRRRSVLTTAEIAPSLRPGMHAATFGGNPLAARAGIAAHRDDRKRKSVGARPADRRDLSPAAHGLKPSAIWCAKCGAGRDDRPGIVDRRRADRARLHGSQAAGQLHAQHGAAAAASDEPQRSSKHTRAATSWPGPQGTRRQAMTQPGEVSRMLCEIC